MSMCVLSLCLSLSLSLSLSRMPDRSGNVTCLAKVAARTSFTSRQEGGALVAGGSDSWPSG